MLVNSGTQTSYWFFGFSIWCMLVHLVSIDWIDTASKFYSTTLNFGVLPTIEIDHVI